jgi:hypothetical protein
MISDDELLIPSALIKMRDELENNSALSCVGGVTLSIWKYGFRTCGYWAYESTFSLNLDDEKLTNRYKKLFDTKEAIPKLSFMWYNLFKSEVLKDILRVTGTITAQVSEFSSLIIAPASGKIKYLNEIYWIRNWNHPPVSTPQVNRLEDILSVFNSDQMNMIKLQETFMRYGNESEFQTAFQLVSNIIEFDYHKLLARNQKANKYAELIPNKLSRYLIFFIKWFFQRKSVPDDFETVLNRMSEKGVKFTYSEIESAVKIVNRI